MPGYSFPRLPLSAYIPGRRRQKGRDEFLSRSRFLAISEFGPRSIVYHEGSKYSIHKVILPVGDDVLTGRAKLCPRCGYCIRYPEGRARISDVIARRQCKASSRTSSVFKTSRQCAGSGSTVTRRNEFASATTSVPPCGLLNMVAVRRAIRRLTHGGEQMAELIYGQAAKLWRINLGWTRRKRKEEYGFKLDTERGFWQNNEKDEGDEEDPLSPKRARVIPFVEDHRNCLLLEFEKTHDRAVMASLQAAIRTPSK